MNEFIAANSSIAKINRKKLKNGWESISFVVSLNLKMDHKPTRDEILDAVVIAIQSTRNISLSEHKL